MKLLFVTACFYPDLESVKLLMESARLVGIPMNTYGMGKSYTPMDAKINGLVESLKSAGAAEYTHVLYTDGADSFLTWDEKSIIAAYAFQGSPPCLISAEKECAPITDLEEEFPSKDHYRYPCAGGFMGEIPYLVEILQWLKKYQDRSGIECNDQAFWQMGIIEDNIAMIDSECEVFQTMSGGAILDLVWDKENGAYYNTITESHPCVLHFNGRVKGIEATYEQWKHNRKNSRKSSRAN